MSSAEVCKRLMFMTITNAANAETATLGNNSHFLLMRARIWKINNPIVVVNPAMANMAITSSATYFPILVKYNDI